MPASVALKATWTGDARPQLPTATRFASATRASCAAAMGAWASTKVRSGRGRGAWVVRGGGLGGTGGATPLWGRNLGAGGRTLGAGPEKGIGWRAGAEAGVGGGAWS